MIRPMNFRMPTNEDIHTAFEQGEAAVMALFHAVATQVAELAQQLAKQGEVLQELQARLAKSSRNSSKPPSSDGYGKVKRTASLRKSGDKPNGGQPGHDGQTLMAAAHPDRTLTHEVPSCAHCQASLQGIEVVGYEERQVFDMPAIRIEVTAHRAEIKVCPACGEPSKGPFPDAGDASGAIRPDGAHLGGVLHQSPPYSRGADDGDICRLGAAPGERSDGVEGFGALGHGALRPSTEAVKGLLRDAEVLHVDESGLRVTGQVALAACRLHGASDVV